MNRVNYLQLMTETYFNTFDVMFEDVEFLNFSFDYRKNQFVKQIERKQKSLDIPLNDFIEEFNFALVFLEDEILINIHKEIKQKSESELNEIRNNEDTLYVPLQCVNTSLTDYLCIKDIDYIKKCFNSFVFISQQPKAVIPDNGKKEFKDFFNSDVTANVVESIQNDFKDFKGKKMAYLIYLLHRDFKIINYSLNSKTESRKHFVSILKGCDFRMTGIDKYFKNADVTLDGSETKDPDYLDLKEKLTKTIN